MRILSTKGRVLILFCLLLIGTLIGTAASASSESETWTSGELRSLRSLSIRNLGRSPIDPSNRFVDDEGAARLGQRIFFDTRFSKTGKIACASCHIPDRFFTDGVDRSRGLGTTRRNAPSVVGSAYSPWQYWDGSRDSLWSQALTPLERQNEMGSTRLEVVRAIFEGSGYKQEFEAIFGPLPDLSDPDRFPQRASPLGSPSDLVAWQSITPEDRELVNRAFAGVGKAIAAYEQKLVPGASRFDRYLEEIFQGEEIDEPSLGAEELKGLRLFIGPRAKCLRCHNGPLLTSRGFHNTGVALVNRDDPDFGRFEGVEKMLEDPFNCLGPYSDAQPVQCPELRFVKKTGEDLMSAFKVPSLRNVAETAPYMHAGQYKTLAEVLEHYSRPPTQNIGHLELMTLNLSEDERVALEAFLRTLTSEIAADPMWLSPPDHPLDQ